MPKSRTKQNSTVISLKDIRQLLRSGEGARSLEVWGDRWSLLILRDAFLKVRRFEDFRRLSGAARGTLTTRLTLLVNQGMLYRHSCGNTSSRFEYHLTDKGMAAYPVALALWKWESQWAGEFGLPPILKHLTCGKKIHPELVCAHCKKMIIPNDISFEPGPGARTRKLSHTLINERRLRINRSALAEGINTSIFHSIDTIGDRWSALLLACFMFGLRRHDDLSATLGIATNILSDRLQRLLSVGVISRTLYKERPPRHEYHLTTKGWDLYPFAIAIQDWGTTWLPNPSGPVIKMHHNVCGHALRSNITCDKCHEILTPKTVIVKK